MEQGLLFGKQLWRVHLYGRSRYGASILVAEQALIRQLNYVIRQWSAIDQFSVCKTLAKAWHF